jgi:hypothetical protein
MTLILIEDGHWSLDGPTASHEGHDPSTRLRVALRFSKGEGHEGHDESKWRSPSDKVHRLTHI